MRRGKKNREDKVKRFYEFEELCKKTPAKMKTFLTKELKKTHKEVYSADGYVFALGTHPVLLVAHMDTVHKDYRKWFDYSEHSNKISSPQGIGGDDRCGIYMILQIIKEINCSVLFCEEEEIGCVGARKYADDITDEELIKPNANYIIEFDRRGSNDAVYYDLDNPEFEAFITQSSGDHFKTNWGSCSDISEVAPALGIAAVNLSCGYYNEHHAEEYVMVDQMLRNIDKAMMIIKTPVEKAFIYKAIPYRWKWKTGTSLTSLNTYNRWDDAWDDYYDKVDDYFYQREVVNQKENETRKYAQDWFEVWFADHDGVEAVDIIEAKSEYEALGYFMEYHKRICFDDILDFYSYWSDEDFAGAERIYYAGEIHKDVYNGYYTTSSPMKKEVK